MHFMLARWVGFRSGATSDATTEACRASITDGAYLQPRQTPVNNVNNVNNVNDHANIRSRTSLRT